MLMFSLYDADTSDTLLTSFSASSSSTIVWKHSQQPDSIFWLADDHNKQTQCVYHHQHVFLDFMMDIFSTLFIYVCMFTVKPECLFELSWIAFLMKKRMYTPNSLKYCLQLNWTEWINAEMEWTGQTQIFENFSFIPFCPHVGVSSRRHCVRLNLNMLAMEFNTRRLSCVYVFVEDRDWMKLKRTSCGSAGFVISMTEFQLTLSRNQNVLHWSTCNEAKLNLNWKNVS